MTVLAADATTSQPMCIAQDGEGNLFFANGLERPQRWQLGMTSTEDVGLTAPATSCSGAAAGSGSIRGSFKAAVQYLDDEGVSSSFSPLASIEATDSGYAQINYTSIPKPSESRVTRKAIWRTTDGQSNTYYTDVWCANTSSVTATGTKTDAQLIASTAMRYTTAKGWPNAERFGVPPSNMSVVQFFQNRSWWAVPGEYRQGTIVASGTGVVGTGTQFSSNMVGQFFHFNNETSEIASVGGVTSITLTTSIAGGAGGYKIIPSASEWDALYFSENAEPESVPASVNKLLTYPDGDRMSGLMPLYGEMYLLKQHHIYRMTTCADPRVTTDISLAAERGCVNQRCWVRVEGMACIMDQEGAYLFNGASTQAISGPVQNYWRDSINWAAKKWFSVVHDVRRECVLFFVALDSDTKPQHALAFSYRLQQWWLEDHGGSNVGAVCEAIIGNVPRVVAGVGSTPCLMDEGSTDEGSAIAYDLKLGRWLLPEVEHEQTRGVALYYEPAGSAHSAYLSHYYDGSSSAETALNAYDDSHGVSVAAGGKVAMDLTQTAGYLRAGLSGKGHEAGTVAPRSLEIEFTGSISAESLTIYGIDVEGIVQ